MADKESEDQRTAKRRKKSGESRPPPPPARVAGSYQRSKVPIACMVCRARKTKCDNVRPVCGFCQNTGGDCRYDESERSRFDPASVAILQQLDDIKTLLQEHGQLLRGPAAADARSPDAQSRPSASGPGSFAGLSPASRTPVPASLSPQNIVLRGDPPPPSVLPQPPLAVLSVVGLADAASSSAGPSTTQHDFDNYASLIQTATDVPISTEALACTTADMGIEAMLCWPVFRRRLAQLRLADRPSLIVLLDAHAHAQETTLRQFLSVDAARALSRPRVLELVENFLINNNVKNPVLEPTALRALAEQFVMSPLHHTPENCLMFIVLAISCISTPLSDGPPRHVSVARHDPAFDMAEYYYQGAQRRIGELTFADSLLAAQCRFLTGVYLMYTMRVLPAWKAFSSAGADCVSYFFTNGRVSPMPAPPGALATAARHADGPLTSTARALEDALYWSCLKGEIELRFEIGLPGSGISAIHYPHVFPSVPDMDDARLSVGRSDQQLPTNAVMNKTHLTLGWFFFLAEITLKRLMYCILQTRYPLGQSIFHKSETGDCDAVDPALFDTAEYDLRLEQWMRLLPPEMQFSEKSTEPLDDILPWVLRGHRIDIVELLLFPAFAALMRPEQPGVSPAYSAAGPRDVAQLAREYLLNASNRIEANASGVFHRHQGSWLTVRSCTRSALALLGTRLALQEQQVTEASGRRLPEDLLPERWRSSVQLVQDMLRAWEPEGRDVAYLRAVVEGFVSLCH